MSAYATPTALPPAPPVGLSGPGASGLHMPGSSNSKTTSLQPKPDDSGNLSSNSADYDDREPGGGKAPSRVTARRAQQNREAQRNFRERRKNYIKDLEAKVQSLISKDALLQKTEQQCRDFQMIVDRLSAERDVWVRERELWWREREEIYRAVEALRMEVRQSQTENRRLREMAWTLWNDVGGRNGSNPAGAEGEAAGGVSTGEGEGKATEAQAMDADADGTAKASDEADGATAKAASNDIAGNAAGGAMDISGSTSSSDATSTATGTKPGAASGNPTSGNDMEATAGALPATPFGDLSMLASLNPRMAAASGNAANGPVSPTDIAHDLLALSRASSPSSRHAQPPNTAASLDQAGNSTTSNALEDLKTRMSFWDAERENLYRAASDRERELLLSSLIPGAPPAAGMNLAGAGLNAMNAAQLFARMAAGLWGEQQQASAQQPQQPPVGNAGEAGIKDQGTDGQTEKDGSSAAVNPAMVPFFMQGAAPAGGGVPGEGGQTMSS
ncbi:uncharacterized protein SPPG_07152 [Spizellomyces punctatus DAOM BR117]|uniref:BZIP domain-containing protein n=1 Tax=Spizellomyces punctatus (strain DAOM BR117) TaxID=645134 RepID=A0A0L0H9W6_SPIPD|nr:uncharacterized protein SPPG_07152 [Spizellomyces punctatus DAOM BR117]KNC97689.1 hypothetical protein SPPG_07152 [Spizellomyces punctatus DAOM BR117]|eukprot:XP_016605729.1 hypothetical protein SPPG_07152 [Spizellomyces punctatus DAOM BR117]